MKLVHSLLVLLIGWLNFVQCQKVEYDYVENVFPKKEDSGKSSDVSSKVSGSNSGPTSPPPTQRPQPPQPPPPVTTTTAATTTTTQATTTTKSTTPAPCKWRPGKCDYSLPAPKHGCCRRCLSSGNCSSKSLSFSFTFR